MPVYQVDIEKTYNGENWTNVYHVTAADISTAATNSAPIVTAERNVLFTGATILNRRVRLAVPHSPGVLIGVNQAGLLGKASPLLPLFNVAMCTFQNGTSRPARKYLRCCCDASDVANGFVFVAAEHTVLQTYVANILGITGICDPQGRALTAGSAANLIGMHQLRRGNRRRPILTP